MYPNSIFKSYLELNLKQNSYVVTCTPTYNVIYWRHQGKRLHSFISTNYCMFVTDTGFLQIAQNNQLMPLSIK